MKYVFIYLCCDLFSKHCLKRGYLSARHLFYSFVLILLKLGQTLYKTAIEFKNFKNKLTDKSDKYVNIQTGKQNSRGTDRQWRTFGHDRQNRKDKKRERNHINIERRHDKEKYGG